MTELLYLENSSLTESTAQIQEVGDTYVILNQTIFYPQGGGQPADKGVIEGESGRLTVKTVEYNGGAVKHTGTFHGSLKVGETVTLKIDLPTRQLHTQWHTAGHLVDLVCREKYPMLIPVLGMHGIGKKMYIEYEGEHKLDINMLTEAVDAYLSSKPEINTHFTTLEELQKIANWLPAHLPTSKKLRVLSIGAHYHIPDGGTQLRTGDTIWPITITACEHTGGNTRLHYTVTPPQAKKFDDSNHRTSTIDIDQEILHIGNEAKEAIQKLTDGTQLDELYLRYLGRNGEATTLLKNLQGLALQDKKLYGPRLNALKKELETQIEAKRAELTGKSESTRLDPTVPGHIHPTGRLHPTTEVIRELNQFFRYHGFSVQEGPELEDVEYNFRRLNLPEGHPATDLQDSLFIKEPQYLMRTHTSSIQTRVLSTYKPPLRVVVPGKCYRNETNSSTNTSFFYQYQGFVVDKGVNIQNLKSMLTDVHKFLFGNDVVLRYRYKYYPEVSPGMGIDMQCRFCRGKGCQICKHRGWIETLGSGMTHYNCYKACGIDPNIYTGYSFGMGLDRLVMSKFGITDIRKLYGGELVYT